MSGLFICRVVSMLEPLACRRSSVGGLICMQGAICLWPVTMFWVDELSLEAAECEETKPEGGNACKADRSEDREDGWGVRRSLTVPGEGEKKG